MNDLQRAKTLVSYTSAINHLKLGATMLLVFGLLASGCASRIDHDYQWAEYSIKPERVSQVGNFADDSSVQVASSEPFPAKIELGTIGRHHYFGSYNQLSRAIVQQYSQELKKRNMEVRNDDPKLLELDVLSASNKRGLWVIQTNMVLRVRMGNNASKELIISNTTAGTVPNMFNGAVSVAVTMLLNDPDITAYLQN